MKQKINNFLTQRRHQREEFLRQIKLLIIITLGFTIAFSWRQTIFDTVQSIVLLFVEIESSAYASIVTSIAITIIAILAIYLTSYFLQDKHRYY